MNCSTLSVPYFLDDSSPFTTLPGILAPVAFFRASPWKLSR